VPRFTLYSLLCSVSFAMFTSLFFNFVVIRCVCTLLIR
jgi:hypothetical protein